MSSLFARDERTGRIRRQFEGSIHAISVVTVGEMRSGAIRAEWGDPRLRALEEHLAGYMILPIDSAVADEWARLRARCLDLGRPKRDNDLWIAATARRHELPLATLDVGQQDIPGLTVIR
ncbi:MAG: PIN domain-containing protein, partial [Chloroflexota bacterium]